MWAILADLWGVKTFLRPFILVAMTFGLARAPLFALSTSKTAHFYHQKLYKKGIAKYTLLFTKYTPYTTHTTPQYGLYDKHRATITLYDHDRTAFCIHRTNVKWFSKQISISLQPTTVALSFRKWFDRRPRRTHRYMPNTSGALFVSF